MITLFIVLKYGIAQHKRDSILCQNTDEDRLILRKHVIDRSHSHAWVKVFRIIPEFSILRLTFHDFEADFPQHFEADFHDFEADFPQKVILKVLN